MNVRLRSTCNASLGAQRADSIQAKADTPGSTATPPNLLERRLFGRVIEESEALYFLSSL